jgi:hypothetical protein
MTVDIVSLPPEILLDIFQDVCCPTSLAHPPHPSQPDALHLNSPTWVLSQVSQTWRTLVTSTPPLWSLVILSDSLKSITKSKVLTKLRYHKKHWSLDPAEDDAAIARYEPEADLLMRRAFYRLERQLIYSKDCALQVYIHPPSEAVDCVADVLAQFTRFLMDRSIERWELYSLKDPVAKRHLDALGNNFPRYTFTRLEHLRYSTPDTETIVLDADFPRLRTALLTGPCTSPYALPWAQLEDVAMQSRVPFDFRSIVPSLTTVRSLLIHELARDTSTDTLTPCVLPCLEILGIRCRWWSDWPTCLKAVVAPNLYKIVLKDMDMCKQETLSARCGIEALIARSQCTIRHLVCINLRCANITGYSRFVTLLRDLPHLENLDVRSEDLGRRWDESHQASGGALSLMNDERVSSSIASPTGRGPGMDMAVQALASKYDDGSFAVCLDLRILTFQWDSGSHSSLTELGKMLEMRVQRTLLEDIRVEFRTLVPENLIPLDSMGQHGVNVVAGVEWRWTRFSNP